MRQMGHAFEIIPISTDNPTLIHSYTCNHDYIQLAMEYFYGQYKL
jgi:hypothetical protein